MNPLFGIDACWVDDGSADSTLVSPSLDTFQASSNQKGTPLNLMLKPSTTPNELEDIYFEVSITKLQGSFSIGVVTESDFHAGFKLRGMLYNGGLTNGMVRLLPGFSDRPAVGDTVGVCVMRDEDKVKVAYYLNQRCLGTGFEIPLVVEQQPFFPCCQVDGTVECNVTVPETLPAIFSRQEEIRSIPYLGEWKLTEATRMRAFGGKDFVKFALPEDQDVLVKLTKSSSSHAHRNSQDDSFQEQVRYDLEVVIINTFRTQLTVLGTGDTRGEKVEVGHVTNTMMMPPLPLVSVENYIEKSLNGLYLLDTENDQETLLLKCHAAEWKCQRHTRTFEAVKSYK